MTILATDIKLMASERLTDFYDGGGEMTGREIVAGQVNNLFPDISKDDRVGGRVSLMKSYAFVDTLNTDMYHGCQVAVTNPPADDNVHVTMFTTNDFYDTRTEAKDRVESYVSCAHELALRPLNDQLEGQRAINCFCGLDVVLPKIGDTIVLKNESNGDEQYVRITDLSTERQTFVKENYGKFTVNVVTVELSAALQHLFPGIEATPYTTSAATRIHATVVADAASYYGVSKMAQPANQGDLSLWVDSIYNQLVPSSQIPIPLVDELMGGNNISLIAKGAADSLTFSGSRNDTANIIHLPDGIVAGSLNLTVDGYAFTDQRGALKALSDDGGYSGTVDNASGQITINRSSSWSATVTITATPAVAVAEAFVTREIPIELANRAFNYTPNLSGPLPAPGSITIAYMAQGQWYELYDNGNGVFVGNESNIGTGTIDYASGSIVLTVGALPDVGTSIIFSWGHGIEISDRSGNLPDAPAEIYHELPHAGIQPGSIVITWDGGTATDAADGTFTGDAVGTISYSYGDFRFTPTSIPSSGTGYSVAYQQEVPTDEPITDISEAAGTVTATIPNAPLRPYSVAIDWAVGQIRYVHQNGYAPTTTIDRQARDNGTGAIINDAGDVLGSIDYATGQVVFTATDTYNYTAYSYVNINGSIGTQRATVEATSEPPTQITASYARDIAASWVPEASTIAAPTITRDLCPNTIEPIVAGSVVFEMDGHDYYDDAAGNLYRDRSTTTGVGTLCGTVNYATGLAELTVYPAIIDPTITLTSLLTKDGGFAPCEYVFRCPGAPVRDGSLSVRATTPDGTLLTAIAGNDGTVVDTLIDGTIDTTNAVVRLKFGELVTAAGNEAESWYSAAAVIDGNIWKPQGVLPETALYNCVIYSFLPLDADLLGIEPIRLPLDGRVPIFKKGGVIVIHHTSDELLPNNLTAGQQITLERDRLALFKIVDQDGLLVPETYYTIDLDMGVLTMSTPLDLSGYVQPLVAATRIEDMMMMSEVQINGLIRVIGPLTHDFPANETQVSSVIRFSDLAARIVRSFTQKTWDNNWNDTRSGDDSLAKFDDLHYPLLLTNRGSIAQRWCIKFTSATEFDVLSEKMGVVASGNTSSDVAPINPATGEPYFRIDNRGWGTGWATGNCLRFDTSSANAPLWFARTTMQGAVVEPTDEFILQIRGDAN